MKFWQKCGSGGVSLPMAKSRVYVDSNIWISAVQGDSAVIEPIYTTLQAVDLQLVISDYVILEVLPKPMFHNQREQAVILQQLFDLTEKVVISTTELLPKAIALAGQYDLTPMDSLHAAIAILAQADEFITLEKPTKPFFKIPELRARSLYTSTTTASPI
ncbi:type II toxin-antitoxin system VapC family toxin [Ectothiorhodospiraceae bacterium BW-2]|nr:type II toxin-antitoxin system VapC family toxin [Ectothiorhodospiraceae bacterium BW-2]